MDLPRTILLKQEKEGEIIAQQDAGESIRGYQVKGG